MFSLRDALTFAFRNRDFILKTVYLYVPTTRALVTPFLTHVTCTCTCACTVRVYSLVSLSLSPAWEERTPLSLSSLSLAGWLPGGSALCRHPPSLTPTHETALVPVETPSRAPAHSAMLSVPPRDAGRARDSGRRPPPYTSKSGGGVQPHRRARTSPAGRALKSSLERICVGSLLQQRGSDGAVRHGKLVDGGAAAARLTGRVH